MRQRNWTFYKVVLYLGLAAAIGLLGIECYVIISQFLIFRRGTYLQLTLLSVLLQVVFYVLCIRLVHYYIPKRMQPRKSYTISHSILLIANCSVGIGWLLRLCFGFSELFLKSTGPIPSENYLALFIVGSYTFISLYLPFASIVLRRYSLYQTATDEESWLQQLGNHSLNE